DCIVRELFRRICELDLEGIVAKRAGSTYRVREQPSLDWIKIKNPNYSQKEGRAEMFDELQGRSVAKAPSGQPIMKIVLYTDKHPRSSNRAVMPTAQRNVPINFIRGWYETSPD